MAQIAALRKDLQPSRVVPYATADVQLAGDVLTAQGAAFFSEHHWYRLAFKCKIQEAKQHVTGFEFSIGPEIPRREWEADNLTDQAEMDD